MIWPVNGVVTSPYGYRTHPIFGTTIYHSGIDIGVDYGTPVHAADGRCRRRSRLDQRLRLCVIIDHGNGLSTLYGHNQELAVSEGQSVSQGQVIAYAVRRATRRVLTSTLKFVPTAIPSTRRLICKCFHGSFAPFSRP